MKRLIFLVITLMFLQQARAQLQASFTPATAMCPWQMMPASGAYNAADEEDRHKKHEKELKKRVKEQQAKLEKIDKELDQLQEKIDRRLQPEISSKVVEHIQLGGNPGDYHRDCASQSAASAGSTGSGIPLPNGGVAPANPNATGQSDVASLPVDRFCEGPLAAAWSRNIQANGRVNPAICRESSQLIVRPGSSSAASACSDALNRYTSLYDMRNQQEKRLAEARSDLDDFEFGGGDSRIEGDCIGCRKQGNGLNTASGGQWMNLLGTVLQVGIPALQNYMTNKQWQKTYRAAHTYEVDNCSRLGYPSHFCYGQYSLAQRYLGHMQQPYPSVLPGYMGSYGGMYGAVPGGIGTGAFGCNPGGFNGMGVPTLGGFQPGPPSMLPGMGGYPGAPPFIGGQGPWGGIPYPQTPGAPGYGTGHYPGMMPPTTLPVQSGAPGYNPYLLNSELNLINQLGGGAPAVLPYNMGAPNNYGYPTYGGPTPLPAPVNPSPYGLSGSFYNINGGTTFFGSEFSLVAKRASLAPMRIENCYDSHVHWRATGDFAERIRLQSLKTPEDILKLEVPSSSTPWILGYGWSFSVDSLSFCTKELLDQWCKDRPVALSMSDGHSLWVNTKALELSGLLKECPYGEDLCPKDAQGKPMGVLKEAARNHVLKSMPPLTLPVITRQLLKAQKIFHDEGITHIRDVHMTESQWEAAQHLESSGLLKLAVEAFVFDEALSSSEQISLAKACIERSEQCRLLRMKGIKIFVDGSLGSETAAISRDYLSGFGRGHMMFSEGEIQDIIEAVWKERLEVAFHSIGDEAAHRIASAAIKVNEKGLEGRLHFEHVQILRDETIELMKRLDCVCHLQPGHWLDDKDWLEKKIGEELYNQSFPWRRLQEAGVPFFFGSDSPLSRPGIPRIQTAVDDASKHGPSRLLGSVESYVSHPDKSWPSNTFTEFEEGRVQTVIFSSEPL